MKRNNPYPKRHKPVHEQVIVITGASSGIGLTTARLAGRRGAKVVLCARNEEALKSIVEDIKAENGQAIHVVADVARENDVWRIATEAIKCFGTIDTWVNNAMVSIFGYLTEVPLNEHRRLFETNYWGVVNGSLTAVEHLKKRGGALINVGSGLGDRAVTIQGAYSASKFAVKGFTEALRMEVEEQRLPISVTLIKPSSIDTPYYKTHAKNYLKTAVRNPPPVYDPLVAAKAILHCAEHPKRNVSIGIGAPFLRFVGSLFPRLTDRVMIAVMRHLQTVSVAPDPLGRHNLFRPSDDGQERGGHPNYVHKTSLYTTVTLYPVTAVFLAGATISLLLAGWKNRSSLVARFPS